VQKAAAFFSKLRAETRCTGCGGKARARAGQAGPGNHIGFYPFPMSIGDENV